MDETIIRQRSTDGYFNIIDICERFNKNFNDWYDLKETKKFLSNLHSILNIPDNIINKDKLNKIILINGTYEEVYIHPIAAQELALWISLEFYTIITKFVNNWYKSNIKKKIKLNLSVEINARIDIHTPGGTIDLVTDTSIIDIQEYNNWYAGLCNILDLSVYFPKKQKIIYLYGCKNASINNAVEQSCKYNVRIIRLHLLYIN